MSADLKWKTINAKKLLGGQLRIKVNCEVKFENYLDVFKKPSLKINALFRVTLFVILVTKGILINYFSRRYSFIVHLFLYFIAILETIRQNS